MIVDRAQPFIEQAEPARAEIQHPFTVSPRLQADIFAAQRFTDMHGAVCAT